MALIDIGSEAIYRIGGSTITWTKIDLTNPANGTGILDTVEIYLGLSAAGENVKVGTFSGSGVSWNDRDYAAIGNVTQGSKQTFSGLSIDVVTGDCIGIYGTAGEIEVDISGGGGVLYKSGDQFDSGVQTYGLDSGYRQSVYATGETYVAPTVTTQAATQIVVGGATLNGNITADGYASISQHGFCWKAGSDPVNIEGADGYSELGAGVEGAFDQAKTGLTENTLYYYRAYATNTIDTGYGAAQSWTTGEILYGIVAISAVPSLTLNGNFYTHGAVVINVAPSMTALGGIIEQGAVSIAVISSMIVEWRMIGRCSIQVVSSLAMTGNKTASGVVPISVIASLVANGLATFSAAVDIDVVSSLVANDVRLRPGTVTITAVSSAEIDALAYVLQVMGYTGTLTAGDVLVIDCDEQTVELNGANAVRYFTGTFPQLYAGTNELIWEDGGEVPDLDFETKHEPRYL